MGSVTSQPVSGEIHRQAADSAGATVRNGDACCGNILKEAEQEEEKREKWGKM